MMLKICTASICVAAILAAAANAEWTPAKPGDPRVCRYNTVDRPNYCGEIAAGLAFQTKYRRVTGQPFAGQLQCPKTVGLTFMCAWKNALGAHQTVVRFAHKATGWKVAVGVIPTVTP